MNKTTRSIVPAPPTPEPIAPAVIDDGFIKSRILTIRGVQVMLDRDLAVLYGVDVKRINEQVKRNAERFPDDFMFHLTKEECLRSQIATITVGRGKHLKYMPYAFTESGVAMLSGVLRSSIAVDVNIRIMRAFVAMRRAFVSMAPMLARLDNVERRQIADQARNEARFDTIFKAMDGDDFPPQKVFYDGQLWDARAFVDRLVKSARKSLLLVDNWATVETLDMLAATRECRRATPSRAAFVVSPLRSAPRSFGNGGTCSRRPVSSSPRRPRPPAAARPFQSGPRRRARAPRRARGRVSRFGASLKDLGKKCFGFTRMDPAEIPGLKARV